MLDDHGFYHKHKLWENVSHHLEIGSVRRGSRLDLARVSSLAGGSQSVTLNLSVNQEVQMNKYTLETAGKHVNIQIQLQTQVT